MKCFFDRLRKMKKNDWAALFMLAVSFVPGKLWKIFSKRIWVIAEYELLARDNGYWFYKYIREKHPEIKAYYPISCQSPDYHKVKSLGNTVAFGSFKHYCLFWAASVFCSSSSVQGFPYPRICEDIVLIGLHRFKYVFLNHGITRGYSNIVNVSSTNYDLLITCASLDKKIIIEDNGQPDEKVRITGFARHDNLGGELYDPKLIVIMPTWREYLCSRNESSVEKIKEKTNAFLKSSYYHEYNSLLNSERFIKYLNDNDLHCVFYLHQNAQPYSGYYRSLSDRIQIGLAQEYDIQTLLKKAAVLITDYSSVCYDFAYMHKPMLYYQFDKEEFENNQYAPGSSFSYEENGFGELCYDLDELIGGLYRILNNHYKMEDKYANRVDDYFNYFDHRNCERIFRAIVGMLKNG